MAHNKILPNYGANFKLGSLILFSHLLSSFSIREGARGSNPHSPLRLILTPIFKKLPFKQRPNSNSSSAVDMQTNSHRSTLLSPDPLICTLPPKMSSIVRVFEPLSFIKLPFVLLLFTIKLLGKMW